MSMDPVFIPLQEPLPYISFDSPPDLIALTEELTIPHLLQAYEQGMFPWYNEDEYVQWWSPDPRFVLFPEELKVSASMRQVLKKNIFRITTNQAFETVMRNCGSILRKDQAGTWISEEMVQAYITLHRMGLAHSVEVWQQDELVGGLYGIRKEHVFFGESMFSKVSNASKAGFITYVRHLIAEGCTLIDCQLHTPHLESLGGRYIPRAEFLKLLKTPAQTSI